MPVYGYQAVNVEAQERSPSSLLHWMRRLIALRRRHRTFGRGTIRFLAPANRKVLAYVREYEGETILCVANLSRHAQPVELDLAGYATRVPVEMVGGTEFPRIGESPYSRDAGPVRQLLVPVAGIRRAASAGAPGAAIGAQAADALDLRPLLLGLDWSSAFDTATHEILERDYLPVDLATRRWFASGTRTSANGAHPRSHPAQRRRRAGVCHVARRDVRRCGHGDLPAAGGFLGRRCGRGPAARVA